MSKINVFLIIALIIITISFIAIIIFKSLNNKSTTYPYFVASKGVKLNIRSGPSTEYPILLTYQTPNIPLKVLDKYERWLKVQNFNGVVGWVIQNLVTKKSFAIVINQSTSVYKSKNMLKHIAVIKTKNVVEVTTCTATICKIKYQDTNLNIAGWVYKSDLWGKTD